MQCLQDIKFMCLRHKTGEMLSEAFITFFQPHSQKLYIKTLDYHCRFYPRIRNVHIHKYLKNTTIFKELNQEQLKYIICNLCTFPLNSQRDIFSINKLPLILKINGLFDIKQIMMLQQKTITSIVKFLTYIITSITASPQQVQQDSHYDTRDNV